MYLLTLCCCDVCHADCLDLVVETTRQYVKMLWLGFGGYGSIKRQNMHEKNENYAKKCIYLSKVCYLLIHTKKNS